MPDPSPDIVPRPGFLKRVWDSWATRSLAVGAVATVIDVAILLFLVHTFAFPNPAASAVGVTVGCTFTFFANRHFAFRDHSPELAPQMARFVTSTLVAMALHAWLVWLLADRVGIHVVLAKFAADLLVFTGGQLLVLRYFVFPKAPQPVPVQVPVAMPQTASGSAHSQAER